MRERAKSHLRDIVSRQATLVKCAGPAVERAVVVLSTRGRS
jgi:hypothetical protein